MEHAKMATQCTVSELKYSKTIAARHSPLRRKGSVVNEKLQAGKEQNIRRVLSALNETRIESEQVFSYHHLVGRPSYRRGFAEGPELHDLKMASGVGGGACQVTNMIYQLALLSGLEIVERHRHSRDLYPDNGRTVPFGCGATVFYNRSDLRFRNTLSQPISIQLEIHEGFLQGKIMSAFEANFSVEVFDKNHRFFIKRGKWYRENEIWRRVFDMEGAIIDEHLIDTNLALTLYIPIQEKKKPQSIIMRSDPSEK